jgi:colanic acid biosynthesis glycosyl transferase WcaI
MRVLLVNQFYPPDIAPTGQHLHELGRCLVARGHIVEVLCSRGSYDGGRSYSAEEIVDGVRVRRVSSFGFGRRGAGRVLDYLSFHLAAARHALGCARGYEVTVCLTTPPYIGWLVPRALGGKGGTRAQWVMDLYPDVLAAHGVLRRGGVVERLLGKVTSSQFVGSALVLTLGPRMKEKARMYAGHRTRLESAPLWTSFLDAHEDAEALGAWRARRGWGPDDLVLLYSGNMGLGHRLQEFLAGARESADASDQRAHAGLEDDRPSPIWAFAGGGQRRAEVQQFGAEHPRARVQLLPYVGREDLPASLAAADVHLVSLRSPWQGLIVPSKLQAAFGLGRPVIFVGPRDSEPADWIAESGGGWNVIEGDVDGLLRAVEAARDPAERRRRGEAGLAFAKVHFDPVKNTTRIAELLEEVARTAGPNDS